MCHLILLTCLSFYLKHYIFILEVGTNHWFSSSAGSAAQLICDPAPSLLWQRPCPSFHVPSPPGATSEWVPPKGHQTTDQLCGHWDNYQEVPNWGFVSLSNVYSYPKYTKLEGHTNLQTSFKCCLIVPLMIHI